MISWIEFSKIEPSLSKVGEKLIFQFGVGLAFLATIRKDGAPRLHPVCPVLSNSRLYVLVLPNSPKRWDLLRDGRFALHAFPEAKPDSDEFYLAGRAEEIQDPVVFQHVISDANHHASIDEILFELWIDRVMHTTWEGFGTDNYYSVHKKWSQS